MPARPSVRTFVRTCERSSHWTDFREIYLKKIYQETPDLAKIGKRYPALFIADIITNIL
jgi:hypothetical protein